MLRRLSVKFICAVILFGGMLSVDVFSLSTRISEFQDKANEIMGRLSPQSIIDLFTSNISSFFRQSAVSFFGCICIILISSVFSVLKSGKADGNDLFELISCCLIILSVFSPITGCFIKVQEHIEAICGFMISLIPACVVLHTASGNTFSASLMSYGTGTIITLLQTISVTIIIPISKASLSLTAVNTIAKNSNLSGISSSLKNTGLWITGLSFTIFTGILSLQSILQAGADNLTMRGLKYGAAKLIPIAGGMISESLKTVITSVGYIKSVTGISGIIFIVYALIPPLCFIMITKIYLAVLSMAARVSNLKYISEFLDASNGIINILLALLLSSSVCLIIILSIFIKSTVSI